MSTPKTLAALAAETSDVADMVTAAYIRAEVDPVLGDDLVTRLTAVATALDSLAQSPAGTAIEGLTVARWALDRAGRVLADATNVDPDDVHAISMTDVAAAAQVGQAAAMAAMALGEVDTVTPDRAGSNAYRLWYVTRGAPLDDRLFATEAAAREVIPGDLKHLVLVQEAHAYAWTTV